MKKVFKGFFDYFIHTIIIFGLFALAICPFAVSLILALEVSMWWLCREGFATSYTI